MAWPPPLMSRQSPLEGTSPFNPIGRLVLHTAPPAPGGSTLATSRHSESVTGPPGLPPCPCSHLTVRSWAVSSALLTESTQEPAVSNQPDNSEAAVSDARPPSVASTGQADDVRPLKIRSTRVAFRGTGGFGRRTRTARGYASPKSSPPCSRPPRRSSGCRATQHPVTDSSQGTGLPSCRHGEPVRLWWIRGVDAA